MTKLAYEGRSWKSENITRQVIGIPIISIDAKHRLTELSDISTCPIDTTQSGYDNVVHRTVYVSGKNKTIPAGYIGRY